jgi:Cdc6-like AAA superfamily ATPase
MIKEAAPPEGEAAANAKKARTDRLAGEILNFDKKKIKKATNELLEVLSNTKNPTIVITGGAGSGKSHLSSKLSDELGIKAFDLDQYIEGGYTKDAKAYEERLKNAFYKVWEDLPNKGGWIIEHVEACSLPAVGIFKPAFAILVNPGEEKIRLTAEARNKVGKPDPSREKRALETTKKAISQFEGLKGAEITPKGSLYILKKLES